MTRADFDGYWGIDRRAARCVPARASGAASTGRSPARPGARASRAPHRRRGGPARGDRVPRPPRLRGARAPQDRPARPRGRPAPDVDPAGRRQAHDARRAAGLVAGVHAVAIETFPDIPGGEEPIAAGDLDEFRARDVDHPSIPKDGFASRWTGHRPGRRLRQPRHACPARRRRAFHDMTAVLAGVARAWHGARAQGRDDRAGRSGTGSRCSRPATTRTNAPMRAVNARLGYRPLPDAIKIRGPLPGGHHEAMTEDTRPTTAPDRPLPPDPAAYDSPRAVRARAKGLARAVHRRRPRPGPGRRPGRGAALRPAARRDGRRDRPRGFVLGTIIAADRGRPAAMTGDAPARRPPSVPATTWAAAHDELVATLRDLIRIPSVNPPPPDPPDGETRVARYIADRSRRSASTRRSSSRTRVAARSRPAPRRRDRRRAAPAAVPPRRRPGAAERWTHDPFAADIADGYVWGRGAVDMKGMLAMQLAVIGLLAAEARAAGRDPAADPIPGLPRDVLFSCDRRRGGRRPRGDRLGRRAPAGAGCAPPVRSTSAAACR